VAGIATVEKIDPAVYDAIKHMTWIQRLEITLHVSVEVHLMKFSILLAQEVESVVRKRFEFRTPTLL
jgi:hypothetical protein